MNSLIIQHLLKKGKISWYGKSKDINKKGNLSLNNFIKGIY